MFQTDERLSDSRPHKTDGRRLRSATSRSRIVEAMLALIRAGNVSPSADQVASAAGVGRRTVFRLFRDMDSIYSQIQALMREAVAPVIAQTLAGDTPVERLHSLVDRRSHFFEMVLPVMQAAAVHRPRSVKLQNDYAALQAEMRAILLPLLPPEHLDDPELANMLDAILSVDMWKRLRVDQMLAPDAASGLLHRMLDAVMATRPEPRR